MGSSTKAAAIMTTRSWITALGLRVGCCQALKIGVGHVIQKQVIVQIE